MRSSPPTPPERLGEDEAKFDSDFFLFTLPKTNQAKASRIVYSLGFTLCRWVVDEPTGESNQASGFKAV